MGAGLPGTQFCEESANENPLKTRVFKGFLWRA